MRVPDQVRKTVLFARRSYDTHYGGTAFIVTVPGVNANHFAFLVTARHVAEELAGEEFVLRANKRDGTMARLIGRPTDPWWFHPTEKGSVDAAVTLFSPFELAQLDVEHVPIGIFVDEPKIEKYHLGVGDEVFITGLFTKITETTKNIPIVRTGTVAMIPGEKIPWRGELIDAYLIESRSIGGLSGSPVFIRETITIQVGPQRNPERSNLGPEASKQFSPEMASGMTYMHGVGRIFFFGSIIGHWDIPKGVSLTQAEAVNMGIAPVVPAHKIREIIFQPELVDMMKQIDDEMRAKSQSGARLDFADGKKEPFTQGDFEAALRKASHKPGQ